MLVLDNMNVTRKCLVAKGLFVMRKNNALVCIGQQQSKSVNSVRSFFIFMVGAVTLLIAPLGADVQRSTDTIPIRCRAAFEDVIHNYFKDDDRLEMIVTPLAGGNSNDSFLIITNSRHYVLRVKDKDTSKKAMRRELFAMQEAANAGISPEVFYFSNDQKTMLMDYVKGGTATTAQTKEPENCIQIAHALRKAHAIKTNPHFEESATDTVAGVYAGIRHHQKIRPRLDEAMNLIHLHEKKLAKFDAAKVNIHGELNPRNLFITQNGIIFIDWEYTSWEDPFLDLSYVALFHDYSNEEELLLLDSYLQHPHTLAELERYFLTKKINFAELSVFFHYFALKLNLDNLALDETTPLKDWSYYMAAFAERQGEISSAQFFYDLARSALGYAE